MSRNLLRAGAALLAFASSPMAFAQSEAEKFYADKALTMVVGYGPGGEDFHAVNERAKVKELLASAKIYADLLTSFAG